MIVQFNELSMGVGMPPAADPSLRRRLNVPATIAWTLLTSVNGARQWLADDTHPGVKVGAPFPIRGSQPAEVVSLTGESIIGLAFPDGSPATVEIVAGDGESTCDIVVADNGPALPAHASGWTALLQSATFVVDQAKRRRRSQQAIVVIHGVGNQRPLATVRAIVNALTEPTERWSKPDQISSSYELRRYQLRRNRNRPRTDLFELYWADRVPGTKVGHTVAWLRTIALRPPWTVGLSLRPIAYLTWAVVALALVTAAAAAVVVGTNGLGHLWHAVSSLADIAWVSLLATVVAALVNGFLISTLGDAARYLDAAPDNITVRQSIRHHGVELLRRLHADGGYDRIVLVGHSLGSVIGYDIVRQYWAEVCRSHGSPLAVNQAALKKFEQVQGVAVDLDAFRHAQRELWCEYRRLGLPWLVTDLVTIGSPLTHAATLLARSPENLEELIGDLELPTCPPHTINTDLTRLERYLVDGQIRTLRMPTHAAVFSVTRWTNLYIPKKAIAFGDPIGGPVATVFGTGVKDVCVQPRSWWHRRTPLAHTSYWRCPASNPDQTTRALAEALDVESGRWLDDHVATMPWEVGAIADPGVRD